MTYSTTTTDTQNNTTQIDESLYSRQLYVLGHDAMQKMQSSHILIAGMNGLGAEIAKNIILSGVKSVSLLDSNPVQINDLSSHFYLTTEDIGKPRALACLSKLKDLNPYVHVDALPVDQKLCPKLIQTHNYQVIILIDIQISLQIEINQFCRQNGLKFISADACGLFASVFVDFGTSFTVYDTNGENPASGIITTITRESEDRALITVLDESRHGLESGDFVIFDEIKYIEGLNANGDKTKCFKVDSVTGPFTFIISGTSKCQFNYSSDQMSGGRFDQVKKPTQISFKSLKESIENPDFVISDFNKMEMPIQLHFLYLALQKFRKEFKRKVIPYEISDCEHILTYVKQIASKHSKTIEINEKYIISLARCAAAVISPIAAAIGGIAASEAMKACSGKFSPIKQFLYFDAIECLPDENLDLNEYKPLNTRYDDQIAVFGRSLQYEMSKLHAFLIGSGAIGCEMLKTWAMMGVACDIDPNSMEIGQIYVTDMDTIERSNLNRQFLFRNQNVGQLKSQIAVQNILKMNPKMHLIAHSNRVGKESESIYNQNFWNEISFVCTALDNVDARLYVDQCCVYYQKALLESGTLGTKGNTQIIVPFLTESYGSSRDPEEKSIPICTLKNFPHKIEHTIQWARDLFEGWFKQVPEDVNKYLSDSIGYLRECKKQLNTQIETISMIKSYLVNEKPSNFENCIEWARQKFENDFSNTIKQLLYAFPKDSLTKEGLRFWSGPKRAPNALVFDFNDKTHLDYIISAANLRAFNYGLRGHTNVEVFKNVLKNVKVADFVPKKGVKIATTDEEMESQMKKSDFDDDTTQQTTVNHLISQLPQPSSLAGYRLFPCEFEKDDPTNFHMDFITACANLRARNYSIREVSVYECKRIAGKIIPAIATTTAMVTGFICLELYKILQKKPISDYKNVFANLAIPFFTFSEPLSAPITESKMAGKPWKYTLWDRIDLDYGDITLEKFIEIFKTEFHYEISILSYGPSLLYSFFGNKDKIEARKKLKMSQVVQDVLKKKLRDDQCYLVFEACVSDENGEDIEIPYIRMKFR